MFIKSTIVLTAAILSVSAAPAAAPKCAEICSMEYNPVCGKAAAGALHVFSNPCHLQVHNCKNPKDLFAFENDGQCCHMMCSMNKDPICAKSATDGQLRIFSNACTLNLFNCQNPQELFLFQAQGECCPRSAAPSTSPSAPPRPRETAASLPTLASSRATTARIPRTAFPLSRMASARFARTNLLRL
ncbi:hypothetical protein BGZ74_000165 [Mortierella antarctica]|nr:hypothetical protein BGZ74_000165 [Mortierella antarctica]